MTRAILDRDAARLRELLFPMLDGGAVTDEAFAEIRAILTPSTFTWPYEAAPPAYPLAREDKRPPMKCGVPHSFRTDRF